MPMVPSDIINQGRIGLGASRNNSFSKSRIIEPSQMQSYQRKTQSFLGKIPLNSMASNVNVQLHPTPRDMLNGAGSGNVGNRTQQNTTMSFESSRLQDQSTITATNNPLDNSLAAMLDSIMHDDDLKKRRTVGMTLP